jgi:hypothetical protein
MGGNFVLGVDLSSGDDYSVVTVHEKKEHFFEMVCYEQIGTYDDRRVYFLKYIKGCVWIEEEE